MVKFVKYLVVHKKRFRGHTLRSVSNLFGRATRPGTHVAMATHRQISSDQEEFIRFNAAALVGEARIAEAAALSDYDRLVAARLAVEREYRAVEKKLRKALRLNPELPEACYILGLVFHEIGARASEAEMFLDAMA
jgi:hypothetical protein